MYEYVYEYVYGESAEHVHILVHILLHVLVRANPLYPEQSAATEDASVIPSPVHSIVQTRRVRSGVECGVHDRAELVGYSRHGRPHVSPADGGTRTVPPNEACRSKVLPKSSDRKARGMRSDNSGQAPTDLDRQATEPLAEARVPAFALPPEPRGTVRRRIRGWRSWLLRFLLLIVSPVLTLGLVEAGLRWSGYGYPTTLFLGPEASGAYRSNDQFGWRFFPRPLARRPLPSMLLPKPPETIRVFVLGESAALGIPDPAFGFGRILDVMLREQYPRAQFEVVNVAMTAINSHVVREIADECTAHEADILVVYMGNNEVTGPFGPGTVFQQWARRPPLVQLSIQAKATRVGQLLDGLLAEKLRGDDSPAAWMGMEMCTHNAVPADSQQLALVYDNFRRNLGDICDIARRAGVSVILSTVAVNRDDFPPLASLHRTDLSPQELARWESLFREGVAHESGGDVPQAGGPYEAAAKIDDRFAELAFRLGRCYAAQGRRPEADECFARACDLDVLRFRADRQINSVIRQVAAERRTAGVFFADGEAAVTAAARGSGEIPGATLFCDHVHLTFDGNYALARALSAAVEGALPPHLRQDRRGEMPSRAQCARLLALTPWDEFQMAAWAAKSTSRAPFTGQFDHAVRHAALSRHVDQLGELASKPESLADAARVYAAALARRPDDWQLHAHAAAIDQARGQLPQAIVHWRESVRLLPNNIDALHQLALLLATSSLRSVRDGKEAVRMAQRAVALSGGQEPMFLAALAAAYAECGQFPDAVETAQDAIALAERQNRTSLADALRDKLGSYRVGSTGEEAE